MTHLWTGGGDIPSEYIKLVMCRDIFHCPPSVLDEQGYYESMDMLHLHLAEHEVRTKRQQTEVAKAKSKSGGRGWRKWLPFTR